jgi:DNA mismatch repair protein MSH4
VLLIKSFVQAVPDITQALLPAESGLLVKARTVCDHGATDEILQMIQDVIEPDVRYMTSPLDLRNQRTFAVKSGINSLLDIARQAYKEVTEQVHTHLSEINGEFSAKNCRLTYTNNRRNVHSWSSPQVR